MIYVFNIRIRLYMNLDHQEGHSIIEVLKFRIILRHKTVNELHDQF